MKLETTADQPSISQRAFALRDKLPNELKREFNALITDLIVLALRRSPSAATRALIAHIMDTEHERIF